MIDDCIEDNGFRYLESKGGDKVLLLLHGLFGATGNFQGIQEYFGCLLYTSPSPRDATLSRMPSSA